MARNISVKDREIVLRNRQTNVRVSIVHVQLERKNTKFCMGLTCTKGDVLFGKLSSGCACELLLASCPVLLAKKDCVRTLASFATISPESFPGATLS